MDEKGDQPLDRALAVIEFVLRQRGPIAASAIADATGLPAATAHRMIAQLEARSLLKRALGSKKVTTGPRLVALGMSAIESVLSSDDVHAALIRLAAKVREHCHVGIVSDLEVRYIDSARSNRRSGLLFEPGNRAPIYCTSIGKCFLASLSPEELAHILADLELVPHTPKTITSRSVLTAQVKKVRSDGWASSNEEFTPGVVGCAVPLRSAKRHFIAGLGVSLPAAHCRHDEIERFLPDLLEAASQIQELLSARE
jgi:DNA-binding IclR family transcriptional regulator